MRASWRQLVKLFEDYGCTVDREAGDHIVMIHERMARPIVLPKVKDIGDLIVTNNIRTLSDVTGVSASDIKASLAEIRGGKKPARKKVSALQKTTEFLGARLGQPYCKPCLSKETRKHKNELGAVVSELSAKTQYDYSEGQCVNYGKQSDVLTALPPIE